MKQIIFALFTFAVGMNMTYANNCSLLQDCEEEDPVWRKCTAKDNDGLGYNYYTNVAHPISYTKKKAVEKCKAESDSPKSCKIVGCIEY